MTITYEFFNRFWFAIINNITYWTQVLLNDNFLQVPQEWYGEIVGNLTVLLSLLSFILTVYFISNFAYKIFQYCWGCI